MSSCKRGSTTDPSVCFRKGIIVGLLRKKRTTTGLQSIPGVGPRYARKLREVYNIRTPRQFIDRIRGMSRPRQRREFLKQIFKGFQNKRKVNRNSFRLARNYLIRKGVNVTDMITA